MTRSIPRDLLDRIIAQRPQAGALDLTLEEHPELVVTLERQIADLYLLGHADETIRPIEMFHLAACTVGAPYGLWITPEIAAQRTGYHKDHIVRLALDGKIPSLRRGPRQLYVHRTALEAYQASERHPGGRPRKEAPDGDR